MALMTSSSGTSSALPAKLVSRRSSNRTRPCSALPRRALTSCLRSISFRGRKSMTTSSKGDRNKKVGEKVQVERVDDPFRLRCQFRQHHKHTAIDSVVAKVGGQRAIRSDQQVANFLAFHQH